MKRRTGFTLVEVSVAGALIGLCVLTAVSIIPRGMIIQNENRMRTVASATVTYLASQSYGREVYDSPFLIDSGLTIANWDGARAGITSAPTGTIYRCNIPANSGRLERQLVFTVQSGGNFREITAWLLNRDPAKSPTRAAYLATFSAEAKR